MLSNIGVPGLILIFVIALVLFGPSKLPELGRAVGQTLREFKKSVNGLVHESNENKEQAAIVEKKEEPQK